MAAKRGVLVLVSFIPLFPEAEPITQMKRLDYDGLTVTGKLIDKKIEGRGSPNSLSMPPLGKYGGAAGSFAGGFAAGKRLSDAVDGRVSQADLDAGRYFYLEYQFQLPKGELIKDRKLVTPKQFDSLAPGAELAVLYHPQNPRINRVKAYSHPFQAPSFGMMLAISAVMSSFGAFLIWRNWRSREARLTAGAGGIDLERFEGNGRGARQVVASDRPPCTAHSRGLPHVDRVLANAPDRPVSGPRGMGRPCREYCRIVTALACSASIASRASSHPSTT